LQEIIKELWKEPGSNGKYTLENEKLHYKGRLVLSATSVRIPKLLQKFHSTPLKGHSGIFRTYRRIAQSLHWKGMKRSITEYMAASPVCQQNKYIVSSSQRLLQPLPILEIIWEELSMDFIVKLPKSNGFDAIMVVVDRLSKYGRFIPLKHPYSARLVAEIFMKEVVRLHGVPVSIISDRDLLFMSLFWKVMFKLHETTIKMSTSYHPESDGQTKVINRIVETYLHYFCLEQPKGWINFIGWTEYWYNTTYQGATKSTPVEVVYGRAPPFLTQFIPRQTAIEAVAQDLMSRDEALKQLKFHLRRGHDQM